MGLFNTGKMGERRRRLRDTIQNWLRDSAQSSTWVQPIEAHGMGQREDLLKDTLGLLGEALCCSSQRTGKKTTPAGRGMREASEDDLSRSSDAGSPSEITASSSRSSGPGSPHAGDGSERLGSEHGRGQARERLTKPVRGRGHPPVHVHGRPASHARSHDSFSSSSSVGRGDTESDVFSKRDADAATAGKSPHPSASWQGFRPLLGRQAAPLPPSVPQFGYMLYPQVPIYQPFPSNLHEAQPPFHPSHVAGIVPSQVAPPPVQVALPAARTPIQDSTVDDGSATIERGDDGDTSFASSIGREDAAPASPHVVDRLQAAKAEFGASMKLARTLRPTPALDRLLDDHQAQFDVLVSLIEEYYEGPEQVARFRRLSKRFVDQLVELVLEQPRKATAPPCGDTAPLDCPERGGAGKETEPTLHVCSDCGVTRSRRFHRCRPARHAVGRNFCGVCARRRMEADFWAGEHFCSQCGCVRSGAFHAQNPAASDGGLLENSCSACCATQRSKTPSPDSDAGEVAVGSKPCRQTPIEVCDLGLSVTDAFQRLQTEDASSAAVGQTLSSPDVRENNKCHPTWGRNELTRDAEAHVDKDSEYGGEREPIRPQAANPTWGSSAVRPRCLSDPAAPWPYASAHLNPQPSDHAPDHAPDQDARDGCRHRPGSSASSFSSSSGRSVRFRQTARVRINADALYYCPAVPDHDVPILPEDHTTPRNMGIYGRYPRLSRGGRPYPLYGQERFHHSASPPSAPSPAWHPHRTPAHHHGSKAGASDEHTVGVFDHHPPDDDYYVRRYTPTSPDDFCGVFSHPINFSDAAPPPIRFVDRATPHHPTWSWFAPDDAPAGPHDRPRFHASPSSSGRGAAASATGCDDRIGSRYDCNLSAPWSSWSSEEVAMPVPGFVEELADAEQEGREPAARAGPSWCPTAAGRS